MNKIKLPKMIFSVLAAIAFVAIFFAGIYPALAAPPDNDDIYSATTVYGLPFYDYLDTSEATAVNDPLPSCSAIREATVWYQYTPTSNTWVTASAAGSSYTTVISVYSGSPDALNEVVCVYSNYPVVFQASTGQTYYIMVAAVDGGPYPYPSPTSGGYGGGLSFSMEETQPVVGFDYWIDSYYGQFAYYFYNWSHDPAWQGMSAYWEFGDGSTSSDWSPSHQFPGEGSYLVSLTVTTDDGRSASTQNQVDVMILQPVANFSFYPYDPSTFDQVQFENWSYDPSCWGCGSLSTFWDLGDGTTSTEWEPYHRYTTDGDYTVSLTVTTPDGRTASTSWNLQVRTHDVAITKFTVPQAGKAGQTRSIAVEINNTHAPEEVLVDLFKSTSYGWQWVGSLQQSVPVRPANRTTSFAFSYTFTAADAQLGRINFRAVASIVNGRDALPTNNEAISLPTKVAP